MNFSKLKLVTEAPSAISMANSEKAVAGGDKQRNRTRERKGEQELARSAKTGLATQDQEIGKDAVSEEHFKQLRTAKELIRMNEAARYSWRKDLNEVVGDVDPNDEEDNHPYVEVMPSTDFKEKEAAKQLKGAEKVKQQSMAAGLRPQRIGEGFKEDEIALMKQRHKQQQADKAKLPKYKKVSTKEAGIKAGSDITNRAKPPVNWNPGKAD